MNSIQRAIGFSVCCLLVAGRAEAIDILSPAPSTVLTSGSIVSVTVGPSPGEALTAASVATLEETADGTPGSQPGTFVAQIHIPPGAAGPTVLIALADLAGGGLSVTHVLIVADPGPLQQLVVSAPPILNGIGEVASIAVKGVFADGITRSLSLGDQGTSYATTNAAVLAVSPSGRIQARSRGTAQVIVTNTHVVSGLKATGGVTVQCDLPDPPNNHIPVVDAGADQTVVPETIVQLDGSASADPDGDPITFLWLQEGGRTVILRGPETATPFFMSPRVTKPETLEFSLVVRDSKGATTLPAIVRVTVQP